ncbi:MAG: hypothetical protein KME32_33055 [Mojavia pulchra JT2-VF2]|uniref:Uncharacterized protein n=1 Tax=Mojavia pulchra JT2-VF2 TaxID=287848 RepID=A0A951Q4T6_9NOST|nr:hypothetical protein [Mojavia pulchra JT2-VF2]
MPSSLLECRHNPFSRRRGRSLCGLINLRLNALQSALSPSCRHNPLPSRESDE